MNKTLSNFFVANDAMTPEKAWKNIAVIEDAKADFGIKVNLDLVLKDLNIVGKIVEKTNRQVFVDLKMWNGGRTMEEVIRMVADQGATMVNIWAQADSMLKRPIKIAKERGLVVLGVTVLTHYDDAYCRKYHNMPMTELVPLLAQAALDMGCDGYILPGTMLSTVKDLVGFKFNPAVRPRWFEDKKANAQEQIMEPGEAFDEGSDIVSCGSPVFQSPDPAKAIVLIVQEIEEAKARKLSK